jgi:leucyl/phenylalanyl-tRNA--protein transferase
MPIQMLTQELRFPPPECASPEGIVAIGGDFQPSRLLLGYAQGIFPWPSEGLPLLWFSPDPRFALVPASAHISRSLRKKVRKQPFEIRFDTAFVDVIRACAETRRRGQRGTWISPDLIDGYRNLHQLGYAHSVEAFLDGQLVGGVYGVALGRAFFGESMFAHIADASKCAFATLLGHLVVWKFSLLDCQVHTDHLARFGATAWPRARFLRALRRAASEQTRRGPWQVELTPDQVLQRISG